MTTRHASRRYGRRRLAFAATMALLLTACQPAIDRMKQERFIALAKEQVTNMLGGGTPRFRNIVYDPEAIFVCGEVARYQSVTFQRFLASGIDEPFLEEDFGKDKIDMMWASACGKKADTGASQ
jgi:hypothetical protein